MNTRGFRPTPALLALLIVATAGGVACGQATAPHDHDHGGPGHGHAPVVAAAADAHGQRMMLGTIEHAIAVMHPTQGHETRGIIRFHQDDRGIVTVRGQIEGLHPNAQHAMHVHEFGDCSKPDATSAGGHYNPEGHPHGLPGDEVRHAGDFGNIQADEQGKATFDFTVDNITIAGHRNPIIGRAMIIHAKPDDGGQPVGNAGDRIACGVIGVAQPPAPELPVSPAPPDESK